MPKIGDINVDSILDKESYLANSDESVQTIIDDINTNFSNIGTDLKLEHEGLKAGACTIAGIPLLENMVSKYNTYLETYCQDFKKLATLLKNECVDHREEEVSTTEKFVKDEYIKKIDELSSYVNNVYNDNSNIMGVEYTYKGGGNSQTDYTQLWDTFKVDDNDGLSPVTTSTTKKGSRGKRGGVRYPMYIVKKKEVESFYKTHVEPLKELKGNIVKDSKATDNTNFKTINGFEINEKTGYSKGYPEDYTDNFEKEGYGLPKIMITGMDEKGKETHSLLYQNEKTGEYYVEPKEGPYKGQMIKVTFTKNGGVTSETISSEEINKILNSKEKGGYIHCVDQNYDLSSTETKIEQITPEMINKKMKDTTYIGKFTETTVGNTTKTRDIPVYIDKDYNAYTQPLPGVLENITYREKPDGREYGGIANLKVIEKENGYEFDKANVQSFDNNKYAIINENGTEVGVNLISGFEPKKGGDSNE